MNADQAWQAVLGQLQMEMPRSSFETWVRDTTLLRARDGVFTIGVRNAYARDWLENRLQESATRLMSEAVNAPAEIKFIVASAEDAAEGAESAPQAEPVSDALETAPVTPRNATLNPRYTFDNFVVGANSRLAHAAALAVAEKPARAYNPLFLYGGVGLGKTHLLHAIGNACTTRGLSILYVSSEEFTNDLINAIRAHTTPAFREKYRSIDVLLVDDIQFIAGKESTQEEFFHTFNTLHGQDKQIIVSSDRPPKAMVTLEERLRSRFEWGLAADVQPPDLETRQAILRYKAEKMGRQVPDGILDLIARRVQSNIRELEGALNRILAFSDLSGAPLDARLVETALADLLPQHQNISPEKVVELVAREWQITVDALLGRDRSQKVAEPRQVAMYLLRKQTDASLPQIGDVLGGRDHTTVMYAIEKISDSMERNPTLKRRINNVQNLLQCAAA
ncbi:MAG: chromosomal replication initiator protein DnaA [Anaerolineae bacterium CG_4_9_14_3_um_filter_57_17]|nr:chromosomal replication initiator protein DnaA [bacterium]NCT21931.1 chromosomal replication initiator protein DnaA [bacterium]OIO85177.1 MAG: chromosomal replication initiation protein DnaA [Anaerolineae bacterium CG2_30_57_67]PJB64114.1 MAG: chromosomal replication initiator protein DnaA [Anaerolineae bacterium CG_4_9_14_3_um_filter_57_17]